MCDWNTPASYKMARIVVRKFQIIIIIILVINPDNVTLSDIMTPFCVTLSLFFFPYHNIKFPLFVWGLRPWVVFTIVYKVHCCVSSAAKFIGILTIKSNPSLQFGKIKVPINMLKVHSSFFHFISNCEGKDKTFQRFYIIN